MVSVGDEAGVLGDDVGHSEDFRTGSGFAEGLEDEEKVIVDQCLDVLGPEEVQMIEVGEVDLEQTYRVGEQRVKLFHILEQRNHGQ